jgi:hypothetical protein
MTATLHPWSGPAAAAALLGLAVSMAIGAVGQGEPQLAAAVMPAARNLDTSADVQLRFIQEGAPESGHVRVELTPDTRPLTVFEARSAAQQAFLEALTEPGLGDGLKQITIVVRLLPRTEALPPGAEQTFRFVHKGGRDWSILAGE